MEKIKYLKGSKVFILLLATLLVFCFAAAFVGMNAQAAITDATVVFEPGAVLAADITGMPDGDTLGWNLAKDQVMPADPSAQGFSFLGWDYEGLPKGSDYLKAGDKFDASGYSGKTITFTAVWGVKVFYKSNMSDATVTITDPENILTAEIVAPLKIAYKTAKALSAADYTFMGWAKDAAVTAADSDKIIKAESEIPAEEMIADLTLYGVWKANFLKVTYHANTGAEDTDAAVTVPLDYNHYAANDVVTILGASSANTVTASSLSTQSTDTTSSDSGTDTTAQTTASATKSYTDANMVRTGYTFAGWATAANSTTVAYKPGATFTITESTDLYAVWTTGSTAETTTTPQTGEEDNLLLYSVIALIALMGIVYLCLDRRKVKARK